MMTRHRRTNVLLAVALSVACGAFIACPAAGQSVSTDAVSRYRPNDLFNCTDCNTRNTRILIHNQRKKSRLDQIKFEILDKLGKADRPMGNVSKIPKAVIKVIMDNHRNPPDLGPGTGLQADGRYFADTKIYSIPQKGTYKLCLAVIRLSIFPLRRCHDGIGFCLTTTALNLPFYTEHTQ